MTMSCVDGANFQCSGSTIIRTDNGVALTSSGVQVYGRSTSDLAATNPNLTGAWGLELASGGTAEIRIAKEPDGRVSQKALLLSNLGLTWDGRNERPQIVDVFLPTYGRTVLDSRGALMQVTLPNWDDLSFYDYATRGVAGTQANYANNRYFPRSEPARCDSPCPEVEMTNPDGGYHPGNWRSAGNTPDRVDFQRTHGDGDIHAGDAPEGSDPPWLEGGTGHGVPFPGSKGYRALDLRMYQYANLGTWVTQDTIFINEWGGGNEHNKVRRGLVAFGDVTSPSAVPASGSATYTGTVLGTYSSNGTDETPFRGTANVTVNFVSREVVVTISDVVSEGSASIPAGTSIPAVNTRAVTTMGVAGSNSANYMTGPVDNGTLTGGLSGRHFGPIVSAGTSGQGSAEVGGTFSLSNSATRAAVIGGFIARKQ
jgi:hypothetical protein